MKIILEAQHACTPTPRGISYYSFQLIRTLLKRKRYEYELTFFDGNKEMNNRQWIDKYFKEFNVITHECNELDYRMAKTCESAFYNKSYNDFTGAYGDVFHFFSLFSIPDNLVGQPVVTIHDMTPMRFPDLCDSNLNKAFRLGLERLKKIRPIIITDSYASKRDILYYTDIPEDKINVIHISFDEESVLNDKRSDILHQLKINSPYLLYIGAIARHKNINCIIDVFETVCENNPDIKLIIAGKPDFNAETLVEKIKDSPHFGNKILYLGYVTDEQKHALYSNAIALLFPSLYEGFGLPVLEAMARECPVITSDVSSLPEISGDAAILIDPNNAEQLRYEIERVVNSDSLRQELKAKGLEQCKRFSWEKTAEKTEDVYKSLMI